MPDVLSRAQRNEIFSLIQRVALDPADFDWSSAKDQWHTYDLLLHRPTNAFFKITEGSHAPGYWVEWWPHGGDRSGIADDWERARELVWVWLQLVQADYRAPDLWGEVTKAKTIPTADRPEYDARFTPRELELLETGLDDIERYVVTTQPLEPDEKEQVQRRFTYLREAARAGARKIDWLNIFVGQIVNMVTSGLLDPKVYGPVMAHAAATLNAVFQFGLKLLGG